MATISNYLTDDETNELIERIKSRDNEAWEQLYKNFESYIHDRAWKKIKLLNMTTDAVRTFEEDLYMAGWQGFVMAIKRFDSQKGKFLTYATHDIDGEISKELDRQLNTLGLVERPKDAKKKCKVQGLSMEFSEKHPEIDELLYDHQDRVNCEQKPEGETYSIERRTLQLLDVLRLVTDENHSISKDDLIQQLRVYRVGKYKNGAPVEYVNTITRTLEKILAELNPLEYSPDNDAEYRIKYEGYRENRLKDKLDSKTLKDKNAQADQNEITNKNDRKKAADITNFSYVHLFNNDQLDQLIQLISFSDMLSSEEKITLLSRLSKTASVYYSSPFFNGEKLIFNPKAVHGRFDTRKPEKTSRFSENLKLLQEALNNMAQVRFRFNRYTAEHEFVPTSEHMHTFSPYHLVVYHDHYYCIGLKKDDKRIWHYRIDLMSDIELVRDDNGRIVPIEVSDFEGLPIFNASWNPEKYMAEHLYMAYDEPQEIHIKIRNTDYTMIHDWFGDHFEKTSRPCEDGYDIVKVKTSPSMIVPWAMQYAGKVEIMDEAVRRKIREEMGTLKVKYK